MGHLYNVFTFIFLLIVVSRIYAVILFVIDQFIINLEKAQLSYLSRVLLCNQTDKSLGQIFQVKVKLYLGPLAGELAAELPFTLMHPKVLQLF